MALPKAEALLEELLDIKQHYFTADRALKAQKVDALIDSIEVALGDAGVDANHLLTMSDRARRAYLRGRAP